MYNAATDRRLLGRTIKFASMSLLLSIAASCSGSGDTEKANALLDEARTAYEAHDYSKAMALIDTLKNRYPREIDVRREALHLATRATEGLSVMKLQEADSLTAVLGALGDSLQRQMKFVKNPIERYYVASSADPAKFIGTNGLQGRVSPDGNFYLISSLKAKSVKSTSVTVSAGGREASTSVVSHDGERNDRSMGAEVITFMGVECDSVGKFISENTGRDIKLTFNGASSYSMTLPAKEAREIALAYDYAATIRRFKVASLEKERLSRTVDIARSQASRTFVEKDSTK
ncbi:MAG: hypothetical protein K2O20_02635 [Duncaniella sp.]|nr:hypothetical protein [Duncaniella sp.]